MRNWERPMVVVDTFAANEFVSSCGDKGTIYKFECDAPRGWLYYYPESDGQIDGIHDTEDQHKLIGKYHPCGAKHEASKTDSFYDGFIDYNYNGKHDRGESVIVWRGPYGNNGHATTQLDMNSWETAKS